MEPGPAKQGCTDLYKKAWICIKDKEAWICTNGRPQALLSTGFSIVPVFAGLRVPVFSARYWHHFISR